MSEDAFNILVPPISSDHSIVLLGSCFSEHIAKKMSDDKISVFSNPFGVVFHPEPMLNLLQKALNDEEYIASDFFYWDNYWFNFEHHSELADVNLDECLFRANELLKSLKDKLSKANHLFLTFGSAWGYELNGKIVANCHQQNGKLFVKKLMNYSEIKNGYEQFFKALKLINSNINICLTVSPVRHYKDGLVNNQISKSTLILFCNAMLQDSQNIFYFPVYEYVIDVLRDYSYFKSDGVHPNELAIEKSYGIFKKTFFDQALKIQCEKWDKIKLSIKHKSLRPLSKSNLVFKENLLKEIDQFSKEFKVNCEMETLIVKNH
jgi:hypothetical protein